MINRLLMYMQINRGNEMRELVSNEQVEMSMRQAGFNEAQIYWTNESGTSNAFESHKEGMVAAATLDILNGVKAFLEAHDTEQGDVVKIVDMLMKEALEDESIEHVFNEETIWYKAYEITYNNGWWLENLYDGGSQFNADLLDGMLTVDRLILQKMVATSMKGAGS